MTCVRERRLLGIGPVHIEVTSTLTQEDENHLAPAVLKLLSGILEMLPVAYMVRIETTDEHVFQEVNPQVAAWDTMPPVPVPDTPKTFVES
jgi:hypothetical protein